jgi:DNA repair protein RadC
VDVAAQGQHPWTALVRRPDAYKELMARAWAIGPVKNAQAAAWLMIPLADVEDQEVAWAMTLDTHGFLRGVNEIARGARDHVSINLPIALRATIRDGSDFLVLFHNHPSGTAQPSDSDAELTASLSRAAATCELTLVDHMILGLGQVYSFRENRLWQVQ